MSQYFPAHQPNVKIQTYCNIIDCVLKSNAHHNVIMVMTSGRVACEWRRSTEEEEEREAAGRQEGAEDCGSAGGGATEQPEYISMITANKR